MVYELAHNAEKVAETIKRSKSILQYWCKAANKNYSVETFSPVLKKTEGIGLKYVEKPIGDTISLKIPQISDFDTFLMKDSELNSVKDEIKTFISEGMDFNYEVVSNWKFNPFTGEQMSEQAVKKLLLSDALK